MSMCHLIDRDIDVLLPPAVQEWLPEGHLARLPDLQSVLVDATVIRAHACAAGPRRATSRPKRWGGRGAGSAPKSMPSLTLWATRRTFFCRKFSRYEKNARNYLDFLRFVSALIWLR